MSEPFDVHEYAKRMFDSLDADELRKQISEGTATGRFPSRPPLPYNGPSPSYLREAIETLIDPEKTISAGLDFNALEARTVAMLIGVKDGKTHIIEQISMDQMYSGKKLNLSIIDDYAADCLSVEEMQRLCDRLPEQSLPPPNIDTLNDYIRSFEKFDLKDQPVKQNGRSAAYLKHDKTKKHKRPK